MRSVLVLLGFCLVIPLQALAQDDSVECSSYDDEGNCLDDPGTTECATFDDDGNCAAAGAPPEEGSGGESSTGGGGIVLTENTPIVGTLAVKCFKLLSSQSSLIQWACEQAAHAAYQECLDAYDGIDPVNSSGRHTCGSAHTSRLEDCSMVPEVLQDLVTVCTEDDTTVLQLWPFTP